MGHGTPQVASPHPVGELATPIALHTDYIFMDTVSDLTLLALLENETTRDNCIRFICGIRKRISMLEAHDTRTIEQSRVLEVLYHAIGRDARNAAFENATPPETPAAQPVTITEPNQAPLISWDKLSEIIDDYFETSEEDEMIFTYAELCDYVETEWTLGGKREWNTGDLAPSGNNSNIRWKNNVSAFLQSRQEKGVVNYSRKRQAWVIL